MFPIFSFQIKKTKSFIYFIDYLENSISLSFFINSYKTIFVTRTYKGSIIILLNRIGKKLHYFRKNTQMEEKDG